MTAPVTIQDLVEELRSFITRDSRHLDECVAVSNAIVRRVEELETQVVLLEAAGESERAVIEAVLDRSQELSAKLATAMDVRAQWQAAWRMARMAMRAVPDGPPPWTQYPGVVWDVFHGEGLPDPVVYEKEPTVAQACADYRERIQKALFLTRVVPQHDTLATLARRRADARAFIAAMRGRSA